MSVSKQDIQQIRKYLNGELDARAMYELELRAQNDPFLMDAMEGMAMTETDQQPHLDAIDQLIRKRVEQEDKRRIIPLYRYLTAACLLIALGIGSWWYSKQNNKLLTDIRIARNTQIDKAVTKPAQTTGKLPVPASLQPDVVRQPKLSKRQTIRKKHFIDTAKNLIAANSPKPNEVVIRGYVKRNRDETTGSSYIISGKEVQDNPVGTVEQLLQGKVAGLNIQNNPNNGVNSKGLPAFGNYGRGGKPAVEREEIYTIHGKVVAKDDGLAMPGATIQVFGKLQSVASDVNGKFNLTIPKNTMLDISAIGYQSQQLRVKNNDSLKIELTPHQNALAEVLIVKRSDVKTDKAPSIGLENLPDTVYYRAVQPVGGWLAYRKYIETNARSESGNTGVVDLVFNVDKEGMPYRIRATGGLTKTMDKKAIDIIKNGPKWTGATKTKNISMQMIFR